jgi:hypothetical protein
MAMAEKNKNSDKILDVVSKRLNTAAVNNNNGNGDGNNNNNIVDGRWKDRKIIPLQEWKLVTYANGSPSTDKLRLEVGLNYFPDKYICAFPFGVPEQWTDKANQWNIDYLELHDHLLRTKYDNNLELLSKIFEESDFQRDKQRWSMHELSYLKQTKVDGEYKDVITDYGCGHQSIEKHNGGWCVPECEYDKPCLHPDVYLTSEAEINSNSELINALISWYFGQEQQEQPESADIPDYGDQP